MCVDSRTVFPFSNRWSNMSSPLVFLIYGLLLEMWGQKTSVMILMPLQVTLPFFETRFITDGFLIFKYPQRKQQIQMASILSSHSQNQQPEFEYAESEDIDFPGPEQTSNNLKSKLKDFLHHIDQNHDSEDEGIEDYNVGGYHPIHIGEVLINRYAVVQKLGWGHFSTVWLCRDFKYKTFVAVKIQKSSPHYMDAAFDEVEILQKCQRQIQRKSINRDDAHVVSLLNSFVHRTPYGNHFCMVFEILRCNLLDILKRHEYQGIPMDALQQVARQVLKGLDFLHRECGVIHTDLKPQNVMVCLSQEQIKDIVQNGQLTKNQLFADRTEIFQSMLSVSKSEFKTTSTSTLQTSNQDLSGLTKTQKKNLKKQMKKKMKRMQNTNQKQNQNREVKAASVQDLFDFKKGKIEFNRGEKLKIPFTVKIADLGNACWNHHHFSSEIQTRQYRSPEVILKQSYNSTADLWSFSCMMYEMLTGDLLFQPRKGATWSKNDDHLAQIQQLLGPFPSQFSLRGGKAKKYFNKNGTMKRVPQFQFWPLHLVLTLKYRIKPEEAKRFADFLLPMLNPLPEKRMSAAEALQSQWLKTPITDYKLSEEQYLKIKARVGQKSVIEFPFKWQQNEEASVDSDRHKNFNQSLLEQQKQSDTRMGDIRLVDRSFTDLGYIGYCDGINIRELDSCANWQFN